MTDEERKLWYLFLHKLSVRFKRQQIIGNYIVDFYCPSEKIVIEIDGIQHNFDKEIRVNDVQRDEYLRNMGLKVFRYTNFQIRENFSAVCENVLENLPKNTKML